MGEKQFDVLVAGELNIDLILDQLEVFPMLGKEILADQITVTLGSSSAIFASNLSTLGATVGFCGRIGRDSFGDKILHDLAQKKVDTRYIVRSTTADTGVTVALNFNQERAMITYPGAMKELTATDISDAMLREAKHLHVSSIFLQPGLRPDIAKLFKRAKELGLTTSLDPQWDPAEKWECNWEALLRYTDVFLPNMEELKNITRKHSVLEAVNVIKPYSNVIVVKKGIEGALVIAGEEVIEQPAVLNEAGFADAIGAGDSFDAGFIRRFIRKKSLSACAELGAVCGAINTTAHGGTTAFTDITTIKKIASEQFNYTIA